MTSADTANGFCIPRAVSPKKAMGGDLSRSRPQGSEEVSYPGQQTAIVVKKSSSYQTDVA
jgi:hypothetical protein